MSEQRLIDANMMTREEAIAILAESKRQNEVMRDNPSTFWASHQMADGVNNAERRIAALDIALSALRPVSREQVEKVFERRQHFTDEAAEMATDRLEALKDAVSKYELEKCLCGDCRGCDREFTASCGDLIDELKEREALKDGSAGASVGSRLRR